MTTTQKLIPPKLGLLKLAEKLGNVSDACNVMGYLEIPAKQSHYSGNLSRSVDWY